jgi:hypothetical protein
LFGVPDLWRPFVEVSRVPKEDWTILNYSRLLIISKSRFQIKVASNSGKTPILFLTSELNFDKLAIWLN